MSRSAAAVTSWMGEAGLSEPRRSVAIACVLMGMALVVLDAAIANVALPTIAGSLRVTPGESVLIVTAYQLALVMTLLPCAALGESLGYRRVFAGGVALFTGGSVACVLAPSLPWLVTARFVQGLGGAAVMALGVALMRFALPRQALGSVVGWNALTVALASAAGPTVGAFILSVLSWPWLFAVNIPLGVMALLAARALPQVAGTGRRLDLVSIALNGAAFASLVVGGERVLTAPGQAAALAVIGATCFMALVRREMTKAAPLIPLDLLNRPAFRLSVIASICCFAGQAAALVALPFYLQHGLGQTPLAAGLLMTPWPLTVALAAPITGRLADRLPTAWLCTAGGACFAIGLAAAGLWPLRHARWPLIPMVMLCGLGFSLFNVPNNRNMFLSAPTERSGAAGGMQGTARLVGQTSGAVAMTLLFTLASGQTGPRIGLVLGAVLTLIAGFVSALRAPAARYPS